MTKKFVVFDLDGTLLDTVRGMQKALNKTLLDKGYLKHDFTYEEVKSFIGGGAKRMYCLATKEKEVNEEVFALYLKYYKLYQGESEFYPHVLSTISKLKEAGYTLIIYSNKPHEVLKDLSIKKNLNQYFDFIQGQDFAYPPKPDVTLLNKILSDFDLDPKDGYYVGDSRYDVLTGRNASLKTIILTYGYEDANIFEKKEYKPDYIIDSFDKLEEILWLEAKNMSLVSSDI